MRIFVFAFIGWAMPWVVGTYLWGVTNIALALPWEWSTVLRSFAAYWSIVGGVAGGFIGHFSKGAQS